MAGRLNGGGMAMQNLPQAQKEAKAQKSSRMQLRPSGCKHCGNETHTTFGCYQKEKKRMIVKSTLKAHKPIKKIGKLGRKWINARNKWVKNNPPNHQGYWKCALRISPLCQKWVTIETLTVDHTHGRLGDLLTDQSNLQASCWPCNELKGSRELQELRP